jgi:hypothetical protein
MLFDVTDQVHVRERAGQLGCLVPDTIAVLPENFFVAPSRHDFQVRAESITLRALFEDGGLALGSFVPPGEHAALCTDTTANWQASLFVPGSKRPAIDAALGLIAHHLATFFRGPSQVAVRLTLVVEHGGNGACRKFAWRGTVASIAALADNVRAGLAA